MIIAAMLASCSTKAPKTLNLDEARTKYAYNNEILAMLNSAEEVIQFCASEYGIKSEKNLMRLLPGSRTALVWSLTAVKPLSLNPTVHATFTSEEAALAKKLALEKEGNEVFIASQNPLLLGKSPAPLLEAWISWPYERKIERAMQLVMYRFAEKELKRKDAETLALFLAEKATEDFLRKKLNPASPILARYISEERDARTFSTLFPDFAVRVRNLYENKDPSLNAEAVQKTRTLLLRTWLADFHQKYSDRFLTNRYVQFGNTLPGDAEIAAWKNQYVEWKYYNEDFMKAGESLSTYIGQLR